MIHKRLLSVCFLILFLVGGCGYKSLYTSEENLNNMEVVEKTSLVCVKPVSTKNSDYGILLRNDLQNKLAPFGQDDIDIKYSLAIQLSDPVVIRRGVRRDGSASIGSLQFALNFQLKDLEDKVVMNGRVVEYSSFNILSNIYASEVSKDYASKQLMKAMADEVYKRVLVYLNSKNSVEN